MDRVARIIVRHSKRILVGTGLVTVLALLMLFRMDFNADVSSFILEGSEVGREFSELQSKYATLDPINVVVSLPEGRSFADRQSLLSLVTIRDELSRVSGVTSVASLIPEVNPLTGMPITAAMLELIPDAQLSGVLDANPLTELLLSEDGRHSMLMVVPADDGLDVAQELSDYQPPGDIDLVLSGNPVVFAKVLDILSWFLLIIPPVIVMLLIGTFYATIGDRRLSILALIPALLGAIWTFGFIFALGREIDVVTVIVPIFVIVMGSADGLHFVTHYQEVAERTGDTVERVRSTLRHVGIPMILTTISTAAGFLSLTFTDVRPIRQMGAFAATGIVFAGIISFFSLPALLSRITVEAKHHTALLGPRLTAGLKRLVLTRVPAIVLTLGLLAFVAFTVPQLTVNSDQLFFFKSDDPVREAFNRTEELFGGATPLTGEFAFDPAQGVGGLAVVAALSQEMEALPGVRKVFSVADIAVALPPEQLQAALSGDLDLRVGNLVSDDGLRFTLLPSDFTNEDLQGWLDFVEENDGVRLLTGMPIIWDEIARMVLRAQVVSLAVAFVLVFIMLMAAYRRFRETVVSLVPVALTIATLLGFIAVSGIQLNLLTAIISSIVLGVGIDYSIHFVAAIDNARSEGDGYVLRAIDRAGRPIVANALGIAIALSALWLSPLAIHPQVSMMMWVSMITAALAALTVIPAMLPRDGVRLTEPPEAG
ncbi:MAG TPA: MMPL family transporter [Acidimicrobiia bacterium]|nr:MMPL family transporter [Acidimicrobiia bacterium]